MALFVGAILSSATCSYTMPVTTKRSVFQLMNLSLVHNPGRQFSDHQQFRISYRLAKSHCKMIRPKRCHHEPFMQIASVFHALIVDKHPCTNFCLRLKGHLSSKQSSALRVVCIFLAVSTSFGNGNDFGYRSQKSQLIAA